MSHVFQRLRVAGLLAVACAAPVVSAAEAALPAQAARAVAAASTPAAAVDEAPLRTDRLEPGAIERAAKQRAPKAPSFPAERR